MWCRRLRTTCDISPSVRTSRLLLKKSFSRARSQDYKKIHQWKRPSLAMGLRFSCCVSQQSLNSSFYYGRSTILDTHSFNAIKYYNINWLNMQLITMAIHFYYIYKFICNGREKILGHLLNTCHYSSANKIKDLVIIFFIIIRMNKKVKSLE